MKIYLAGAIDYASDKKAFNWRKRVRKELPHHTCHIPTRVVRKWNYAVMRDLNIIRNCDIVLANLYMRSWGTPMEIAYAKQWKKKVYAIIHDMEDSESAFLKFHVDRFFYSLDEAIAFFK